MASPNLNWSGGAEYWQLAALDKASGGRSELIFPPAVNLPTVNSAALQSPFFQNSAAVVHAKRRMITMQLRMQQMSRCYESDLMSRCDFDCAGEGTGMYVQTVQDKGFISTPTGGMLVVRPHAVALLPGRTSPTSPTTTADDERTEQHQDMLVKVHDDREGVIYTNTFTASTMERERKSLVSVDDEMVSTSINRSTLHESLREHRELMLEFMGGFSTAIEEGYRSFYKIVCEPSEKASRSAARATHTVSWKAVASELRAALARERKMTAGFVRLLNRGLRSLCASEKDVFRNMTSRSVDDGTPAKLSLPINAFCQVSLDEEDQCITRRALELERDSLREVFMELSTAEEVATANSKRSAQRLDKCCTAAYDLHLALYRMLHAFYRHRWKWTDRLKDPLRSTAAESHDLTSLSAEKTKAVFRSVFAAEVVTIVEQDIALVQQFTEYITNDHAFGQDFKKIPAQKLPPTPGAKRSKSGNDLLPSLAGTTTRLS